jgi:hypothetical protein
MLKVNFLHVCDNVILEEGTGKFSIIGVFENLNAQNFPAMHPTLTVIVGFENKNPGLYDVELVFLDEQGELQKIPAKVNIGVNGKGIWAHKIFGYTIPREMTQKIKLNYEGNTIYETYLTVNNK